MGACRALLALVAAFARALVAFAARMINVASPLRSWWPVLLLLLLLRVCLAQVCRISLGGAPLCKPLTPIPPPKIAGPTP